MRERKALEREAVKTYDRPPDNDHDWLSVRQVAELLEVSRVAVLKRCQRDRLPHTWHDRQIWVWGDLLEQVERARQACLCGDP